MLDLIAYFNLNHNRVPVGKGCTLSSLSNHVYMINLQKQKHGTFLKKFLMSRLSEMLMPKKERKKNIETDYSVK